MTDKTTRPQRSPGRIGLEFLGSMNLAIALLMVVAVASVIGTVLQQHQPYQDYQIKFGPFWFEVFRVLGLYDVYGAIWFLVIMAFLVLSITVCVWRNAPHMLRDIRRFRLDPQRKSLLAMGNSRQFQRDEPVDSVVERAARELAEAGYRTRRKSGDGYTVVSAMRGGANRIGYIISHVAIVVICIGALIDGNLGLKLAELTGRVVIETRDIPASQVPSESILGPETSAYRGNVTIPEGAGTDLLFLSMQDGYVIQKLPFRIELEAFRVEHYPNGMPRSYESDLVIHDPEREAPFHHTIRVNEPLVHRGVAIYQASFQDGGSVLHMNAIPLQGHPGNAFELKASVLDRTTLNVGGERVHLEIEDFELFNVERAPEGSDKTHQNFGPSFTYRVRTEAGDARQYETYMLPAEFDGRYFYVSGVRSDIAEPMRWLHIPASPADGSLGRFMELRSRMLERERVRTAVADYMDQQMANVRGERREAMARGAERIVVAFARGGLEAVMANVESMARSEREAERMGQLYRRVLDGVASRLYDGLLEDEGIEAMDEDDVVFYGDAIEAMMALPRYGAPFFLELKRFEHRQASGLQIAKAPGQNTVYLGSVLLVIGLFLMFYVAHRRVWVRVEGGEGAARIIVAGTSNRHPRDFSGEFEQLADQVAGGRRAPVDGKQQEGTP